MLVTKIDFDLATITVKIPQFFLFFPKVQLHGLRHAGQIEGNLHVACNIRRDLRWNIQGQSVIHIGDICGPVLG